MLQAYSHSALKMYEACPREFAFRYIEKPRVSRRVTADTYMGQAVHRTLAELYRLGSQNVLLSQEDAIGMFRKEWEKPDKRGIEVLQERMTVDDYIENGCKMLREFYEQYQPFNQGRVFGVEYSLRFRLSDTPFDFRVIIDRLWKRDDGVVEICDYKTGQSLPQGTTDPRFYRQMGLYQLAVMAKFPQFEKIAVAQYFLRQNEVLSCELSAEQLDELREGLRQSVLDSIRAERLSDFPTKEGRECTYCAYTTLCPAKRHRQLISEEAGEGETDNEHSTAEMASELAERYLQADLQYKAAKAERDALHDDIVRVVGELHVDKLVAKSGEIRTRISTQEKFITKTSDPQQFAELSHLANSLGLSECFELSGNLLMKEVFRRRRLPEEQLKKLGKYVVSKESIRVVARHNEDNEDTL